MQDGRDSCIKQDGGGNGTNGGCPYFFYMNNIHSLLNKIYRAAILSFENAVRLHEDAVLLYLEDRVPSALHTSILSIEELGKYYIYEDICFHNSVGEKWPEKDIRSFLKGIYSHRAKQMFFAHVADRSVITTPLIKLILDGHLEEIKQKSTYVGFPRRRNEIDFSQRVCTPSKTSKKLTKKYITLVNDFFIELAAGTRNDVFILDIPEIQDWLTDEEFEKHFRDIWPHMSLSTKRFLKKINA